MMHLVATRANEDDLTRMEETLGGVLGAARARPLPWPEREAAPPAEPSHPEGLIRIAPERDGAMEAPAGGLIPAASSTCATETEIEGRLRHIGAETASGAHQNIRRSRLRSAGIDLPRQQPSAPGRFDVDAEAPATWSEVPEAVPALTGLGRDPIAPAPGRV